MGMSVQTFVSTDETGLAPLRDLAIGLLNRDGPWRRSFVQQIAPRSQDVIFDIGCGDGSLALLLADAAPGATIVGIDPDLNAIQRAQTRAAAADLSITFVQGYAREAAEFVRRATPTKIVSSLLLHKLSPADKRETLDAARSALTRGGQLHIADYGAQRNALMQRLFQSVELVEGAENLDAHARGALPALIRAAGFEAVEETQSIPTMSGSLSFYRARAA
jgi:ubiquinone/menaquinone biosynthesis C-methylase UbiE